MSDDLPVVTRRLSDIVVDPEIQVRSGYDEPTIRRYQDTFDALPPVDVFVDPKTGVWLLADGYHRTEAGKRLGRRSLKVRRHEGDRAAAVAFAALANLKHGLPLSRGERNRALIHLHTGCGWTITKIASAFDLTQAAVSYVLSADKVRRATSLSGALVYPRDVAEEDEEEGEGLSDSHYLRISRAPRHYWQALVTAAVREEWTRDEAIDAIAIIRHERVTEADKQALLAGEADLDDFQADGTRLPARVYCRTCLDHHRPTDPHLDGGKEEPLWMPGRRQEPTFGDVKAEVVAEMAPYETATRLRRLLYGLDTETRVPPEEYVRTLPAETRERLLGMTKQVIERLTNLQRALAAGSPLRELARP